MRTIDAGAMGFIPQTSSDQLLLNALRFVLAGGVYLPVEILRQRKQSTVAAPAPADIGKRSAPVSPRDLGLTLRQAQVLSLVLQGKPNKLICRELDVAEGTVKIHVAAILRALGVDNRTQAVIEVGPRAARLRISRDVSAGSLARTLALDYAAGITVSHDSIRRDGNRIAREGGGDNSRQ